MTTKIVLGLTGKTPSTLVLYMELIISMLTGNAFFPTPSPTLVLFTAKKNALLNAINDAKAGSKAAMVLRQQLFAEAKTMIRELATWLMFESRGDAVKLATCGYALITQGLPIGIPLAPANLRQLKYLTPGAVKFRYNKVHGAETYLIQWCTGDPTVEANWSMSVVNVRTYYIAEGVTPLSEIYFRVAAVGVAGQSNWSDPLQAVCVK